MTDPARILIVEHETEMAARLAESLHSDNYRVSLENRGDRAAQQICRHRFDLVILDLMLPDLDGLSICRQIRPVYSGCILMLTANGCESDETRSLESGADDCMAKPIQPRLLLARVRALLRRSVRGDPTLRQLNLGSLEVNAAAREVAIDGTVIHLTTAEFDLLWLLALHAGEVLTRDQICQGLRGFEWNGLDRSVDLRVSRLRKKLGDDGRAPARIKSVRSVGYMLVAQPRA